jgi:hypothetical protein
MSLLGVTIAAVARSSAARAATSITFLEERAIMEEGGSPEEER